MAALQRELTFSPTSDNLQCIMVSIVGDSALEDEERVILLLTSQDERVQTVSGFIQIQDDDSKYNYNSYLGHSRCKFCTANHCKNKWAQP